ncbi:AAA family ATPase [Sulfuricella sp.]|uniref:AAA family ATPase n=1 Tax=Sulfuricella sp. TaxID=2099377 RepID=UPI002B515236|nr:AAA family ATPase [Sulfuricella sp.]HUX64787.1 AAA family ATPase [Sulfuricella sp.]
MVNEIDRARAALRHLDAGCPREDWVKAGMGAKAAGLGFDDFHHWSASAGNYASENECRAVWKSFNESGGVTPATLYGMAFAQGWQDPAKSRAKGTRPSIPTAKPTPSPARPVKTPQGMNPVEVWNRCISATPADGYIYRKQGKPDGMKVYPASAEPLVIRGQNVAGYLVAPCWSGADLQTLQFIPPDGGDKLNLPGASFNDGFFTVGDITDRVFICEGIGQAWAANKATGAAAVVCFGAGRMMAVGKVLRAKYPAARLVVVPDRGKEEQAATIAAAIAGQWMAMPDNKPSNYDANDYAAEKGSEALAALLERPQAPSMRFKLLSGADLCNSAPMRWMVRGVLPVEGLAALFGASGSGKSFLMLDIGCAVAGGDYEWFGRRVNQCPVTYVCLEGEAGMGKRVKAWSLHYKKPVPDALQFITQPFDLLSDDVPELAKAVIAGGGAGGLVILDTLNRAAPGADENSSVDMGNLIAAAKQLQRLTGGMVLLVHHTGKDTTKGLRGHSSLYAALDGAIEVINSDTRRAWSVAKSKDDVTGDAHPFKLEIVPVGNDDEGEEITSCVAVPDESDEGMKARRTTLGANQKIAFDVLGEPLRKSSHIGKEGAPVGRPCLDYSEAVEIVAERMPTDAKHRKSRAISAIGGLVAKGYMGMKGEWLWCH